MKSVPEREFVMEEVVFPAVEEAPAPVRKTALSIEKSTQPGPFSLPWALIPILFRTEQI